MNTVKQAAKLFNYLASNPHAKIQYRASAMQLAIHSHVSYISVAQDRIWASRVHFLSKVPPDHDNPEYFVPTTNGISLFLCKIVCNTMVSAAEDKYRTIFVDAHTAVPIRTTLSKIGWKQVPPNIQVDNSTAVGIVTKDFLQNKSMAMDM